MSRVRAARESTMTMQRSISLLMLALVVSSAVGSEKTSSAVEPRPVMHGPPQASASPETHKALGTNVLARAPIAEALIQGKEVEVGNEEQGAGEDYFNMDISPAEELRLAAQKSGYNITDIMLNLATTGTEEEITEMLPKPLAEALIDRRRRPDLRDRMIGMTFLGQPIPLDRRPRRPFGGERRSGENRRRMKVGQGRRQPPNFTRRKIEFPSSEASPRLEILKPFPIKASRTSIIFPEISGLTGGPNHHRNRHLQGIPVLDHHPFSSSENHPAGFPFPGRNNRPHEPQFKGPQGRPFKRPIGGKKSKFGDRPPGSTPFDVFDLREEPANHANLGIRRPLDKFPRLNDDFGNSVGPDFGPVIYEFEHNIEEDNPNSFLNFDNPKLPSSNPKVVRPLKTSSSSHTPRRPPHFSQRPKPFAPSKPFSTSFSTFGGKTSQSHQNNIRDHSGGREKKSGCTQYSETICLDADNYPHSEILASLEGDKARANVLIAEVRNQSADNLVDGLTARQEERYDYSHYFGNSIRRQDSDSTRNFADEGGYLCPSEVKYARPKRARNSKGQWKFIVNMDKYTQTIRMEKCIKPGGACSYVSHHYQAMCNQIHNYQRLLSWEKKRGLHMDIFKVPSCCTCHIQGYSFVFPPLDEEKTSHHQREAGSRVVESRLATDKRKPNRIPNTNRIPHGNQFSDGMPPNGGPPNGGPPNGGPFTTPPHGVRRMQQPFARSTFRHDRTRRTGAPHIFSDVKRMDVNEPFESRRNAPRGGNRIIGGGGLEPDEMLSFDDRGRSGRPDDMYVEPMTISEVRSFSTIRRGAHRGPGDQAMDSSQSSINYDYHPILQFFKSYPQPQ